MEYLIIVVLAVVIVILGYKMIIGLKAYNQALRLQARADYYQARIERLIK